MSQDSNEQVEHRKLQRSVNSLSEPRGPSKSIDDFTDYVIAPAFAKIEQSSSIVSAVQSFANDNPDLVTKVLSVDKIKAIRQSLGTFAESSQVVMKALSSVEKIHPFIGCAVLALKAAIQLELTRRENDRKIMLLKSEIVDMMAVLIDLGKIPSELGTSVGQSRLKTLVEAAAEDIRDCCATCEAYLSKRFIVKLFTGSSWETKLAGYFSTFHDRRDQFTAALSIYTAQGVGELQKTMSDVDHHATAADNQAAVLVLFEMLDSPNERALLKFVKERGGAAACLDNDKIFEELQAKLKDIKDTNEFTDKKSTKGITSASIMVTLRDELRTDIDIQLSKEREDFNRKFNAVQDGFRTMTTVVQRSTDRIVEEINDGPHSRVVDKDIHVIWKDMAWRGSVKARHFVIAVRDYFVELYSRDDGRDLQESINSPSSSGSPSISRNSPQLPSAVSNTAERDPQGKWAIGCITLPRIRSIVEAFDRDASGWISVKEANDFTANRPLNYSIVKWLAYWAAGFRASCVRHAQRIQTFRAQMLDLTSNVLPANRAKVDRYLRSYGLPAVDLMLRAILDKYDHNEDSNLICYFDDYHTGENQRLRASLERFRWKIDASNTLHMITGSGHIEQQIFPLLDLLLERHTSIIRLACSVELNDLELTDAMFTLNNVMFGGVYVRLSVIVANYRSQNLNPKEELTIAYHGMFCLLYEAEYENVVDITEYDPHYQDLIGQPDQKILNYPVEPVGVPSHFYASLDDDDDGDVPPAGELDGLWVGRYDYGHGRGEEDGLVTAHLTLKDNGIISGWGKDTIGDFLISGTISFALNASDRSRAQLQFDKRYTSGKDLSWRYSGRLNGSGEIDGMWGTVTTKFLPYGRFTLNRVSLLATRHRPSAQDFAKNRARARWTLATSVIQERIRRKMWSWSYFRQRRDIRRDVTSTLKNVLMRREPVRYLRLPPREDEDYGQTLSELERKLVPEDAAFYRWLGEHDLQREVAHLNVKCDGCPSQPEVAIIGGRHRCLECVTPSPFAAVDFCDNCAGKDILLPERSVEHHSYHDVMKTLRMVHDRDSIRIIKAAKSSVSVARRLLQAPSVDTNALTPKCHQCNELLSCPCWYCTECYTGVFLCMACEAKQLAMSKLQNPPIQHVSNAGGINGGTAPNGASPSAASPVNNAGHSWMHVLVKIQDKPPVAPQFDLETRITNMEQQFVDHEAVMRSHISNVELKIKDLVTSVETVLETSRDVSELKGALKDLLERWST